MTSIMIQFGEWLRVLRKERQFDIRTLAERTGVEAATISRVENARTQVTLQTCVRLCQGLEVTEFDVISALYGKSTLKSEGEGNLVAEDAVPSVSDVEDFLTLFRTNGERGKTWLTNLLNRLTSIISAEDGENTSLLFVPEDIQKLLLETSVYRFEIQYPSAIAARDIYTIYKRNGMLTLIEIGEYIKKVRRQKQLTMAHLEQAAKFSPSVLSRLESGFIEQIKLADVLMLEDQLEQKGILLGMYWRVFSFYEKLLRRDPASAERDMRLASIFIVTCRWLQFMKPRDVSWINDVHSYTRPV